MASYNLMYASLVTVLFLLLCYRTECQSDGDLRLVTNSGLTGGSSGRLELYYYEQWGTVCDYYNYFDLNAANVACRQLGFAQAVTHGSVGWYFSGAENIWIYSGICLGTESRLVDCLDAPVDDVECSHYEDIALVCSNINIAGTAIGAFIGGSVLVIAVLCVGCCICCLVRGNKRSHTSVDIATSTARPSVITNTYQPGPSDYSRIPQIPPADEYSTQIPTEAPQQQPVNSDLKDTAPPSYADSVSESDVSSGPQSQLIPGAPYPTAGYPMVQPTV